MYTWNYCRKVDNHILIDILNLIQLNPNSNIVFCNRSICVPVYACVRSL